jgi:hypothetical protein
VRWPRPAYAVDGTRPQRGWFVADWQVSSMCSFAQASGAATAERSARRDKKGLRQPGADRVLLANAGSPVTPTGLDTVNGWSLETARQNAAR